MIIRGVMQDVLEDLPHQGLGRSYLKNVRAAVKKMEKIYRNTLRDIPVDACVFRERWWDREPGAAAMKHFADARAFRDWRGMALAAQERWLERHAGGAAPLPRPIDDWDALLAYAEDHHGRGKALQWGSQITLSTLARLARSASLPPRLLTSDWAAATWPGLRAPERKGAERGLTALERLREHPNTPSSIQALLPPAPVAPPARKLSRQKYDGRLPANLARSVHEDFQRFVDMKRGTLDPDRLTDEEDRTEFADSSADAYGHAVGWLFRELVEIDALDPNDVINRSDLCTCANIRAAARSFIARRSDPLSGLRREGSSVHSYVAKVSHVAETHCGMSAEDAKRLKDLRARPQIRTASVARMSADRRRWIQDLDRDARLQRRLLMLPETLMRRSREILDRWETLKAKKRLKRMMDGLKFGIAAAQAAILLYGSPLRAANLNAVPYRGEGAMILLPQHADDPLQIAVPGEATKNGAAIEGDCDPEALPILRFYIDEVRTKLVSDHPYNKNYSDSVFLFPSCRQDQPMDYSVFSAAFAWATAEAGLEMEMHLARHVSVFFLLDEDPNGWGEASALLGDDIATVKKFYAWMKTRKAHSAARAKLRRSRSRTLRRRAA
jgi:hypothetical protein